MHIPFCRQACTYCNFHFTTSLRYKDALVDALVREAIAETAYLEGQSVETVYFGGGTPSLLTLPELERILGTIRKNYPVATGAEITLEANPDDIGRDRLQGWKDLGINRLSIGVQSFHEEELRWMNRAHSAREARESLELAVAAFDNITMDLIYGSPLLTDEGWKENVDLATGLGVPHLSCYALTVEEKTPLNKLIEHRQSADVDSDKQARQFLLLMHWLREKGYEHYEVSNWAKPGFRSRHNSSYWRGVHYLGLGPSAHSFNGVERRWNVANNSQYIAGLDKGTPVRETERLSDTERLNEFLMISLRTMEGIDLERLTAGWGEAERQRVLREAAPHLAAGHLLLDGGHLRLTDTGMLLADGIAAGMFA